MVYRVYVEKKQGLTAEADALRHDIVSLLGVESLTDLRLFNRYDVENIEKDLFEYCKTTVFSEPQLDDLREELPGEHAVVFAVEYLPGQFDQRANSAAECIQIISKKERPLVRTAKVFFLYGKLTEEEISAIKKYVINPVEAREAALDTFETLAVQYEIPTEVATIDGFLTLDEAGLDAFVKQMGLAMDLDDIKVCQAYFKQENRNPTITEIKMIDTYWSDHCRHTTFLTTIDDIQFEDSLLQSAYEEYLKTREAIGRTKPINLMDMGTIAAKFLKQQGKLTKLDESEEINACTVKIDVNVEGETQKWLLLFKNETHNHPTEIEPFGGAATCVGGAIRDPLSGRSYVYAAMRVTGAGDPTVPVSQTIPGKLPQRKIVTTAAAGYSSYGNQIGLATGQVDEIYHPGYVAKRMEIGAVIGAAPAENVRREEPIDGDIIILLGGRTGRDGCGGATGSSKSHTVESLESCGAEVQKGNAPEERKLQRLFRNQEAAKLIKRCNDFGAGGVSVAIGELAPGLVIDLNAVPKKYEGLDGTELAISESQERMAVVVAAEDVERFKELAYGENLEATVVAEVKAEPRLIMHWNGKNIVNISRKFLDSNGAEKHISIAPEAPKAITKELPTSFKEGFLAVAEDLNVCSKRGLSERFDSTIGAGTVLMPFGGKTQRTPIQAMVNKVSVEKKDTTTCSLMAWGYNPFIAEASPYHSAYLAVVESVTKLVATGAKFEDVYLSFQEYFEKPLKVGKRWGKPLAALLGAFMAQKGLEIAAIGGKDSMSGSFEHIDVPPTLVSFAVTTEEISNIISPEFKGAGHKVALLLPEYDENGLPTTESLKANFDLINQFMRAGKVLSAYTPTYGGVAEAILKMSMGNELGFTFAEGISLDTVFGYQYGGFLLEMAGEIEEGILLGETTEKQAIVCEKEELPMGALIDLYEGKLEKVFPCNISEKSEGIPTFTFNTEKKYQAKLSFAQPKVLIPVFPGTNCEYDSAKAVERAGAKAEIFVINNLSAAGISDSIQRFAKEVQNSQMIFIPGGFSGGDEPDGSGKFITAFFRNPEIKEVVTQLLEEKDGLMCGICNGFQALIKLGLVPFGKIMDTDETCPTLSYNTIGRHQSKLVRTRIASNNSPWLMNVEPGEIFTVPVSHGEGRLLVDAELVKELAKNGQILTQYVDDKGNATNKIQYNPNGSVSAIEGLISPNGRIIGKMGHSERVGDNLYQNVQGKYDMKLFLSAVQYYK
ncbi:phosphoribosylformylglycinamidine synthase [Anaerotignum neopropionicum]|uniref:Phosphoribosylformylglycinamidine synthase n=1 Tax=Anaerotignum neopropionicum TaxID=36847 RepID=A0A136WCX5_9FIRM|nr:phosphoribosylformylglycinamidine synthase [Anaerotignum neopropionicum]KXL52357.1 phosphoribosylformylglycinamidine synthase [Anaerotignum neopropionicum]